MQGHADRLEDSERLLLRTYVAAARQAIAELRPSDMRFQRLPSAMSEIGMIIETTETAANQIMDSVDEIMAAPQDLSLEAYRGLVEQKCMSMMEACAFQDLAGQRSTKVIETLLHIEDKLGALAELLGDSEEQPEETPAPANLDDLLLNGPAMPGEGVDQDEIDRLFATGG